MLQEELTLLQKLAKDLTEQITSWKMLGTIKETVGKTEKAQAVTKKEKQMLHAVGKSYLTLRQY